MRLLVVGSHSPFPPRTGSSIVAYHSMRCLAARHAITFLCPQQPGETFDAPPFLRDAECLPRQQESGPAREWRRRLAKLRGIPSSITKVRSEAVGARVRELAAEGRFDAIVLFSMDAVQYCPRGWYRRIVAFIEDPQSLRLARLAALPLWTPWERLDLLLARRLTRRYERRYLPQMGRVLLLAEDDMRDMREQDGYANLGVVPYGAAVSPDDPVPGLEERAEGAVVFSGNMFHPANVDGALTFLRDAFPLVLSQQPGATLWIVGAEPDARIRRSAAPFGDRVIITGRVDDVSAHLRRARVSICPVRVKIGCQTKVLEALACGTPVVTTSAGNNGVRGRSGTDLIVADDAGSFAHGVVSLLRGQAWHQLSARGRQFIEEQFSWERSAGILEEHIAAL